MIFLQSSMLIAVHQWMAEQEQEQQSILISVIIFTLVWGNRSSCKVHPQQHISYTWSSQQHDPQQSISDRCQSQWFAFSQPHIELNDGEWTWQFDWMSCDAIDLDCNSCDCWRSIDMVIVYWLSSSSSAVVPCNLYIDTIHSLLEAQHVRPSTRACNHGWTALRFMENIIMHVDWYFRSSLLVGMSVSCCCVIKDRVIQVANVVVVDREIYGRIRARFS